ncbi:MAG: acyl carrier protein [Burkholderiales bacterium]
MINNDDVLTWLADVFEDSRGRIKATTLRKDIPGWDSLGTLSLIAALDEKFDIHLSEQEIEAMDCVGDVIAILQRNGALEEA